MATAAARTNAKVLISGESGVGKEVVARLIHRRSARSRMPFVAINCAGIPESLLESELFGHVRGSFTGADRDRTGMLEAANGGTLFLDEIGETSLRMQALLLRFLETGDIQRVGADRQQTRLDVRMLAASNRDLLERIKAGAFRLDLYYRLNVVHLKVPPLRERREDVPVLLQSFLEACANKERVPVPTVGAEALALLQRYNWPGNVRELRNVAERLIVRFGNGQTIGPDDLPTEIRRPSLDDKAAKPSGSVRVTRDFIDRMVKDGESFWSVVHAPFMARDLTRNDVRAAVAEGLALTRGSYKHLIRLFNMPASDYKQFLSFLRKHDCHIPFQRFRTNTSTDSLDFDGGAEPPPPAAVAVSDEPKRISID
jgi:transcriptional regulator with PAS, ATPase and Fis domain